MHSMHKYTKVYNMHIYDRIDHLDIKSSFLNNMHNYYVCMYNINLFLILIIKNKNIL